MFQIILNLISSKLAILVKAHKLFWRNLILTLYYYYSAAVLK